MAAPDQTYYIGVDVGTGSARAALVDSTGGIVAESTYGTKLHRDDKNAAIFEQSSVDIWNCIAKACKDVLRDSRVLKEQVKGIGFDATCSLAVASSAGKPVSVDSRDWGVGEEKWNVILWADHRAEEEANLINSTGSMVLNYVGGTMSLEMEMPKMLWLKKHMPEELFNDSQFFDLPDFLTFRATGDSSRSNCSLGCKCSYVPPGVEGSEGWNKDFLNRIGLKHFVDTGFKQLGGQPSEGTGTILTAGQPVGKGLSEGAAEELGLCPGTAVGSAVIDAYAGWIGTVAAPMEGHPQVGLEGSKHRLAAIAGTSTCHIAQSKDSVFVPGVWGPYLHAVFPGYWMNEGGQSSTGQLLDFMVETHAAFPRLKELAKEAGVHHFQYLSDTVEKMAKEQGAPFLSHLTRNLFLYPDLHGNRSPLADFQMRGVIIGMALDSTLGDLALKYLATCEAIALQTRHIVESMNKAGHDIQSIFMSGGLAKNQILMQLIADCCKMPVQLPFSSSASVVLGSAVLGAIASREITEQGPIKTQAEAETRSNNMKDELWNTMTKMSRPGKTIEPKASEKEKKLLEVKWKVFMNSIDLQRSIRKDVAEALA